MVAIKDVETPSVPENFRDAAAFLRRQSFLDSSRYREQQWKAYRVGADVRLLEFERVFIARLAKLGIPAFADEFVITDAAQRVRFLNGKSPHRPGESPSNHGRTVSIVHSLRGRELPAICWDLFHHVGEETAKRLGVEVNWGGPEGQPWRWEIGSEDRI